MNPTRFDQTIPLIIGVGNLNRGDDAVGILAARALNRDLDDVVDVVECDGEGAQLLDHWQGREFVVLIDAVKSSAPPGTVYHFDASQVPVPRNVFRCSSHAFGVNEAIEMSRALGRLPRYLLVIGIEGRDYDEGSKLSAAARKGLDAAIRYVVDLLSHGNYPTSAGTTQQLVLPPSV